MTSQNEKKDEKSVSKTRENSQNHSETIRIEGVNPEKSLIKCTREYHAKTRQLLAISLVISLLIVMIFFGVLHAVGDKEMIESLEDLSRYSITILSSLTSAAIGFFFGRDVPGPGH